MTRHFFIRSRDTRSRGRTVAGSTTKHPTDPKRALAEYVEDRGATSSPLYLAGPVTIITVKDDTRALVGQLHTARITEVTVERVPRPAYRATEL